MKITSRLVAVVTFSITLGAIGHPVYVQERRPDLGQLYRESEPTLTTIARQIESRDPDQQFLALDTLESQIESGAVDRQDPQVLDAITPLVDEGVFIVPINAERPLEISDPTIRRQAVKLMASLGSTTAREKLQQSVLHDPNPIVTSQALLGLGQIARDPTGTTTRSIVRRMATEHYVNDEINPRVIDAALQALRAIVNNTDNVIDPATHEMLIALAGDGRYLRNFRNRALEILSMM